MYEQMELEYVAFSKNRFSIELVQDHLIHMILTKIEPNYKFVSLIGENSLSAHPNIYTLRYSLPESSKNMTTKKSTPSPAKTLTNV